MKKTLLLAIALMVGIILQAQEYRFNNEPNGFSVSNTKSNQLTIKHNLSAVTIEDADRAEVQGQVITLSGVYLSNEAGAPDLPSSSTFVAIPNGATPTLRLVSSKTKVISNVDLIPAAVPQLDDDNSPTVYQKDASIYGRNAFYPESPIRISEVSSIRGVQMVLVGVMPFQYNPVTKELVVYTEMELEIETEGGNGAYGDPRYRTPEWDQILQDILLNRDVLPKVDYGERLRKHYENRETGCEYMIITPDDEGFIALADTIKQFRSAQGIPTEVYTVTQCGGNSQTAIRNFIRNAYNNWDMPPAAVLFLGDHNEDGTKGIVSYTMNNHPGGDGYNPYISDHAYAVMGNDDMPEIILGRITGRNFDEMYHMIKKDLDYERTPPTSPDFYDHPITAMGFQLERWFQLCSEVVYGFFENELGKHPVRQNAIYQGTPGSRWSTYEYTNTVLNYFGPNGCGYIPRTMSHLTDWSATGNSVNEAINSGAFLIQHRDHGAEEVWGEPSYNIGYIKRLTNPDLTFVMSNNCLTGRFNYGGVNGECFAEAFHRHQYGALGLIAATEVSYSFVNDVYVWGAYDNMWPDFMPTYGTQHATNFIRPAFGNAAGKYFLRQSSWTDDGVKEITYYLFHHHGDAYMTLYTEVPQKLTVECLPVLPAGSNEYTLKADEGATLCLTANGQIIGYGMATGNEQHISITPQEVGTRVKLTVTKQDYYRYERYINTIPAEGPYLIFNAIEFDDEEGNGNHAPDYDETSHLGITLHNVGFAAMDNFNARISCSHRSVEILQDLSTYNSIGVNETQRQGAFVVRFGDDLYNQEKVKFFVTMENEGYTFNDSVIVTVKAPDLKYRNLSITDLEGAPMDRLLKGTSSYLTFDIENQGESKSKEISNRLSLRAPFLNIADSEVAIPAIEAGATGQVTFRVDVDVNALETYLCYTLLAESGYYTDQLDSQVPLGYTSEDFEGETLTEDLRWRLGSGEKEWIVVEEGTAPDGHCLRSPAINSGTANLYIGISTETEGKFSFLHKVSTDGNSNIQFLLNNATMDTWSGDSDWELSEYELPARNNILRFIYTKDASSSEDNVAMLDNFLFPPYAKLVLYAGDSAETCGSEGFTPNGYIYNHEELIWTTNGDGTFDDATLPNPTYTFGSADMTEGQVELTLTGVSSFDESQQSSTLTVNLLPTLDPTYTPVVPNGPAEVDLRLNSQSEFVAEATEEALYIWSLDPATAGTLTSNGRQTIVEWNGQFRGTAHVSYVIENPCGSTSTSEALSVNVFNSTGVGELDGAAVSVYPNPATDMIHVSTVIEGPATLRIVDAMGRIVYEKDMEGKEDSIATSKLGGSGVYFLIVVQNNAMSKVRFVVMP